MRSGEPGQRRSVAEGRAGGGGAGDVAGWPAGEVHTLKGEATEETRRLVRELAADDFATRERATTELATKGTAGFPGLREVVETSGDEEARARTARLLAWEGFQVPENVPAKVARALRGYAVRRANVLLTNPPGGAIRSTELSKTGILRSGVMKKAARRFSGNCCTIRIRGWWRTCRARRGGMDRCGREFCWRRGKWKRRRACCAGMR